MLINYYPGSESKVDRELSLYLAQLGQKCVMKKIKSKERMEAYMYDKINSFMQAN